MKTRNPSLITGLFALLFAATAAFADMHGEDDEDEMEFDEAHVFFELNNTDGDLGIHALIDGEPWKRLRIEDQRERRVLDVKLKGRLRRQGLTELFFESAEPTFDELSPEEFFDRFPEGTYEIEGTTLEGDELESETEISHAMPAPPTPTVNGKPLVGSCDEQEPVTISAAGPIEIAWPEVTLTHPNLGFPRSGEISINNYELVVEVELDDDFASVFSIVLPPDARSVTMPDEFVGQGTEFKYEVLAREESYNQTAVECYFKLE